MAEDLDAVRKVLIHKKMAQDIGMIFMREKIGELIIMPPAELVKENREGFGQMRDQKSNERRC